MSNMDLSRIDPEKLIGDWIPTKQREQFIKDYRLKKNLEIKFTKERRFQFLTRLPTSACSTFCDRILFNERFIISHRFRDGKLVALTRGVIDSYPVMLMNVELS